MRRLLSFALIALAAACTNSLRSVSGCLVTGDCEVGEQCVQGACIPSGAGAQDAGAHDAGSAGAGSHDAGPRDAGTVTATLDAGSDAGLLDAGPSDAGESGAGLADAGSDGGSAIGPTGGTVDLLDFVFTGDTRPPFCDLTGLYPQAAFQQEVESMASLSPQFALDLGDHMFICTENRQRAIDQMKLYTDAITAAQFKPFWFMTMGNHECLPTDCSGPLATLDANYRAYSAALATLSQQPLPYYKVDIQTRLGLARLVFIADNYSDTTAQGWAADTLAEADSIAKYTIVLKHHPVTGSDTGPAWSTSLVLAHKYTLLLTAHEHEYLHDTADLGGRSVICGLGGANTNQTGFCRVTQQATGELVFTQYDSSANPMDSWSVTPQ